MNEIKKYRDCAHWHPTAEFPDNCWLRHWDKDESSQDTTPDKTGCKEYADRCVAFANEAM